MNINFNTAWQIFVTYWPAFWYGIKITMLFAVIGTIAGFFIGLVFGGIRTITINEYDSTLTKVLKNIVKAFASFYIWLFRGSPMLIQATFIYYSFLPIFNWDPITAGLVVISINTGAYMAEIIRSGIQSIDKGQTEAAKSLGMKTSTTFIHIIFPQAVKNTLPSIGNQLIVNIKDSSMLNAISVTELYFQTTSIAGTYNKYAESFFISLILYLILTSLATLVLNYLEKRFDVDANAKDFCC